MNIFTPKPRAKRRRTTKLLKGNHGSPTISISNKSFPQFVSTSAAQI